MCFSSCLQCQKVQTTFSKEILSQAKLAVASSSPQLTLITQLTTMSHTMSEHLSAHYTGITLTRSTLPITLELKCLLFASWKPNRGKAVIKSYCYRTSLNTDTTWRIRISINTCPHSAMELGPIKCHHILGIRMLPWQSITKILRRISFVCFFSHFQAVWLSPAVF